jgi:hypothetical protein
VVLKLSRQLLKDSRKFREIHGSVASFASFAVLFNRQGRKVMQLPLLSDRFLLLLSITLAKTGSAYYVISVLDLRSLVE